MKDFFELTDHELLALGIPLEEETDGDIAQGLKVFIRRKSVWLSRLLGFDKKWDHAESMEARHFCETAVRRPIG